ncbi:MAG: hypothetical protein JO353_09735 [Phycisphaerae bacterium]|nr:hypothetical protein [Phycisphaerae bacterium]
MRKWEKRALFTVGLLLLIIGALAYRSIRLLHGTPQWYRRSTATLAEKEAAARRAFNKFVGIQNVAATIHNDRQRARATQDATTEPAQTITVSFTDDELNAFFEKWSNFEDWKQNYDSYVENPIILLKPGQILLAGQVRDLDTIATVEFDPSLDDQGQLDLKLTEILGGRLPIPQPFVRPYFHKITDVLRDRLPAWRQGATIEADGAANKNLICASLSRLLIRTLQGEPTDPILFLPVVERHANVPAQIVGVIVGDHWLTVTVRPLDHSQRQALVDRIHAVDPIADSKEPAPEK